jgi:hypothetical protein
MVLASAAGVFAAIVRMERMWRNFFSFEKMKMKQQNSFVKRYISHGHPTMCAKYNNISTRKKK